MKNKSTYISFFLMITICFVPRLWAGEEPSSLKLTLKDVSVMTIEAGSAFIEPGFSAFDTAGRDISSQVKVEGDVDVSVSGRYPLIYQVNDIFGNSAKAARFVSVVDTSAPTITAPKNVLVASEQSAPVSVTLGEGYAEDASDLSISNDAPDVFPVGVTTVLWTATDRSGNSASAKQLVTVVVGATVVQLD